MISFFFAAIWMASRLMGPDPVLRLRWPPGGFRWRSFRDILKVGLVACLVVILTNGTVLTVTGLVGRAGDAAIAGYGIGSRLEYMLVPISFGIGGALTALVGTNIGARQHARARRMAWSGALMAGAIATAIGLVVAISPDLLARPLHPRPGRARLGPHLSQHRRPGLWLLRAGDGALLRLAGHRRDDLAGRRHLARITIAVCGSLFALDVMGWGTPGLFTFVALGIVSFAALLAFSTTRPAWRATSPSTSQ